jgi:hypothetical protein
MNKEKKIYMSKNIRANLIDNERVAEVVRQRWQTTYIKTAGINPKS